MKIISQGNILSEFCYICTSESRAATKTKVTQRFINQVLPQQPVLPGQGALLVLKTGISSWKWTKTPS